MTSKNIYGVTPKCGDDGRYHYVYRITNIIECKHYYGSRTSRKTPYNDLGLKYFGSLKTNKWIIDDQKQNPHSYKYKILKTFSSRKQATQLEIKLHKKFNVKNHNKFYNMCNQTSNKFDTTGLFACINDSGNIQMLSKEDPKFISGEYKVLLVGFCKSGKTFTENHRKNLSLAAKGKPKSKLSVEKGKLTKKLLGIGVGKTHPRSKYIYITPMGEFDSPESIKSILSMSRVKHWCLNCDKPINISSYKRTPYLQERYSWEFLNGKTYRDIGFSYKSSKI